MAKGLSVLIAVAAVAFEAPAIKAQPMTELPADVIQNFATITATFPGDETFGTVIAVHADKRDGSVGYVTAEHVVRVAGERPTAAFVKSNGLAFPVDPQRIVYDRDLRVAYLTVETRPEFAQKLSPLRVWNISDLRATCRAAHCEVGVTAVARDQRQTLASRPLLLRIKHLEAHWRDNEFIFQACLFGKGSSGGGVLTDRGDTLGLVQEVGGAEPNCEVIATPFEAIRPWLRSAGLGGNLIAGSATLHMGGTPSGAQLTVDQEPKRDLRRETKLVPGEHSFLVEAPDHAPKEWTWSFVEDDRVFCTANLATPTSVLRGQTRWWLAGASGVLLAAGGVSLAVASHQKSDFDSSWSSADYDAFKTWNTVGSALTIAGVVSAGAAALWWFSGPATSESTVQCGAAELER